MKLRMIALPLLIAAAPSAAHDFWLQPARFQVQPGALLAATFLVGHGALRDRWGNNDRIMVLSDFFRGKRRDLRADIRNGGSADLVTNLSGSGLHILGMQTNYASSELPAIRFNDYAKEEGLAAISAHRVRAGMLNRPGRERYSRRAKSLVQVGPSTAADHAFATRRIGLKLEIVPERSPYALDRTRNLPVYVVYNGRRLANATVKLTNLANDERPVAVAVTDRAGRARFRVPASGNWLLNVVWGEPVKGDPKADYDTTFSSLTFGYPARPR